MKQYRYAVMVQIDGGPYDCVLDTSDKYEAYDCQEEYKYGLQGRVKNFDTYIDVYEATEEESNDEQQAE